MPIETLELSPAEVQSQKDKARAKAIRQAVVQMEGVIAGGKDHKDEVFHVDVANQLIAYENPTAIAGLGDKIVEEGVSGAIRTTIKNVADDFDDRWQELGKSVKDILGRYSLMATDSLQLAAGGGTPMTVLKSVLGNNWKIGKKQVKAIVLNSIQAEKAALAAEDKKTEE